jgi:asparagine synthase (glutamine-hydrolysing)
MCGIAGIFGSRWQRSELAAMVDSQDHRGPDGRGVYVDPLHLAGLGHNRLSIIDLSDGGLQPMSDATGRIRIVFNGEIYNYLELRSELGSEHHFRTQTDTEVLLAAYEKWGPDCLEKLIGMFAFAVWDERTRSLFAARDRFGVKPLYYSQEPDGTLRLASEIRALHAGGVAAESDPIAWATYFTYGLQDHSERTFWRDVRALPPGHKLSWKDGRLKVECWYDLAERIAPGWDDRPASLVQEEYLGLLSDSVRLRFRSDVPIGINLSGGLDSSTLLGLVQKLQGAESDVNAYTFVTGDKDYDELPWVEQMLAQTRHPLQVCRLTPNEVPSLAESVQRYQDEPFGGLPTLAYARLFEQASAQGVTVLLDGSGLDEQWAGYDYYQKPFDGVTVDIVQGTIGRPVRPECLLPEFRAQAEAFTPPEPFPDRLRNLQYRDIRYTKMPRALRFNDRISMRTSNELREPFLDHRLFELAFRQAPDRKIVNGARKWMLREIARQLLPDGLSEAPKRPLQTPQREWLRGPLRDWADDRLREALNGFGGAWLNAKEIEVTWKNYCRGASDNSFYVWQWISLSLLARNGGPGGKYFREGNEAICFEPTYQPA